jgi:hypothetical protein
MVPISIKDKTPPYDVEVLVFCPLPHLKEGNGFSCMDYGFSWGEWNMGTYKRPFTKPSGWKDSDYYERYSKPHWNNSMYDEVVTHWMHKPLKPIDQNEM